VEPYYTSPAPTTLNDASGGSASSGTGSSATGDSYTGKISGFTVTPGTDNTSATATWSYQGSATFEIEEKNPNNSGTNYYFIDSTNGRSFKISDLDAGTDYGIRIRADRSDGTVSEYSDTTVDEGGTAPSSFDPGLEPPGPYLVTPPITISLASPDPDPNGVPTVNWQLPAGVTATKIQYYRLVDYNGQQEAQVFDNFPLQFFSMTGSSGQTTLGGIPLGESSIFAVYYGLDGGRSVSEPSNTIQVDYTGVPVAPAVVTATTVMQSDGSDEVAVHWQNTSDNEAGYELQRSVDGAAFTDLTTIGADETSYSDDSIPYDFAGNADLKYRIESVAQVEQAHAAISQPTTSGDVDPALVTINSVRWYLDPAKTSYVSVDGYKFSNFIIVTGTNLQKVEITQFLTTALTGTDEKTGNVETLLPNDQYANTGPNWVGDGGRDPNDPNRIASNGAEQVLVLNTMNTAAKAIDDDHAGGPGAYEGKMANGPQYCEEMQKKNDFKDEFTLADPKNSAKPIVKDTFYWGYQWSNYSYQTTAAQGAPAGIKVCASTAANGSGVGMFSGEYGDGVNLSGVPLK
jgi:hypothetical protein